MNEVKNKIRQALLLGSFDRKIPGTNLVLQQRVKLFKITTFFSLVVFAITLYQSILSQTGSFHIYLISTLFVSIFINYFAFSFHRKPRVAFTILVILIFTLLHIITYWSGGIRNSGIFFLGSIILVAYMLLGKKGGKRIAILAAVNIVYFYFISRYTNWTNYSLVGTAPSMIDFDFLMSGLIAIVLLAVQADYIEKSKNEIIDDIDSKKNQLSIKNQELEQFAYVASHDLQEPLRTISSFVSLLEKQYSGKLDEKADKYLLFIVKASERMKKLISDLLDYSRIGITNELLPVDCNAILREILADIGTMIDDTSSTIMVEDLPVVNGFATELKQLFQNLIINAIKFRKEGIEPVVAISAKSVDGFWQFCVKDNGIGIEEASRERVFVIFQRLHTRTEYEGSGIGLSHCKKIAELHKGQIWFESEFGKGSEFYFTIPQKQA